MDAADANQVLAVAGRAAQTIVTAPPSASSKSAPVAGPCRSENTYGFRRRAAPTLGGG